MTRPPVSLIVPTLDEAAGIEALLAALQPIRSEGGEVILVDGGSTDATATLARPLADLVLSTHPGRARQMNAGAAAARGEVLWFLHADTRPDLNAVHILLESLRIHPDRAWGRFDVLIDGRSRWLALIARFMNLRSRLTGIATGDQGIFVRRAVFERLGGYPEQPLMEDIELSRALKRVSRPLCLRPAIHTSGRRWERHGVLRTMVMMWSLRLAYCLGARPERLALRYRRSG